MPEKAQFTEPPGSVPDSGDGRINDLHLARLLARLAATANIRRGRETVLSTPKYFTCRGFHGTPEQKSRFSVSEM